MYLLPIPASVFVELKEANRKSESVQLKLQALTDNPIACSIETETPAIGDYYVNAGKWCILYNIDTEKETVCILAVVRSPFLHKILTNRIQIPEFRHED